MTKHIIYKKKKKKRSIIGAIAIPVFGIVFLIVVTTKFHEALNKLTTPDFFAKGVLTAVIEESPLTFTVNGNDTTGMDYLLLKHFAMHHGLTLKLKVVKNFDEASEALLNGECDIIATGIPSTMKAKSMMHLSVPLYKSKATLVHNIGHGISITSAYDLAGKTITLPKGSHYAIRIANMQHEIKDTIAVEFDTTKNAFELIRDVNDNNDAMTVCDDKLAAIAEAQFEHIKSFTIGFEQEISFGTSKNADELNKSLDQWLTEFKATDSYTAMCKAYLNTD